jgi:hypothetical protein
MKKIFVLLFLSSILNLAFAQEAQETDASLPQVADTEAIIEDADDSQETPPTKEQKKIKWRVGVGVAFNVNPSAKSDLRVNNRSTAQTVTGEAEFDMDDVASFELDFRRSPSHDWGFIGGLSLSTKTDITSGSITLNGNTVTFSESGQADQVSWAVFSGSIVYRWNEFYIPFGLNFSLIEYDAQGITVDATGGLGAQLGIGFLISHHFSIELLSKAIAYDISYYDSSTNLDIMLEEGYISTASLAVKYVF